MSTFIEELISYDYILFGGVFILFILLIILGILKRKKFGLSIFLIFLSFLILILVPTLGYVKMHEYLFKNSTQLTSQKRLTFTQAVIVNGTLLNESKFNFQTCKITASATKVTGNPLKDYILGFNPFKNMSIIEENIAVGELREFKIIIEPFTYSKDYNISVGASCR
ncbi:MAG: hypothetical protein AUK54_07525 [Helicobacteraceae bacterium CG2_30_36_10]|nr:MAG: hypothetical protein AUK54_07525 [Helicobacteraceae bacterium CG2_30_36_10]